MMTLTSLVLLSHMTLAVTAGGSSCGPKNMLHDSDIDLAASPQAVVLEVINNTSQDDCNTACCDREEADKCNLVIFEQSSSSCTLMACVPQEICAIKDSNDHEITILGQTSMTTTTQAVKTEETTSVSTTQLSDRLNITGNNSTMHFNTSVRTSTPVVESISTTQFSENTNISDHTSTTVSESTAISDKMSTTQLSESTAISDKISTTQLSESTSVSEHTSTPVRGGSNASDNLATTQVSGSSSPSDEIDTPVTESAEASDNVSTTQVSLSVNPPESISTTQASENSNTFIQTTVSPQSGGSNVTNTVQSTGPSPLFVKNDSITTSAPSSELSNSTSSSTATTVSTTLNTLTTGLAIKTNTPDSQSSSVASHVDENSTLSITTVSTQLYNSTISLNATTTPNSTVQAPVINNYTESMITTSHTDVMNKTTVIMGEIFDTTTSSVPETSKSETNEEEHALQTTTTPKKNDTGETIQSTTSNPQLPSEVQSSVHTTAVVNGSTAAEPVSGMVNASASGSSDVAAHKFEPLSAGLIAALSLGIIFFFAVLVLLGKRLFNSWQRRHYNRMDYLINGMYN